MGVGLNIEGVCEITEDRVEQRGISGGRDNA